MEQYLRVGVVSSTHGLKGEVKVFPTTDDKNRFDYLDYVFLDEDHAHRKLEIESARYFKQMVILKFKGYDKIEDIEKFKGCDLYVDRENAVPLEEGEYYIADLIDMKVITDDGEELGVILDVMETGANDVYVVKSEKYGEVLIPAIEQCILDVDVESNIMKVRLLPGLLEL